MIISILLPVLLPILAFPLIYLFRRRNFGAHLAALISLLSAWLAWHMPTSVSLSFLGRPVTYDYISKWSLMILFLATAILFLAAVHVSQGWSFYPFALLVLGVLGIAMLFHHLAISALVMEVGALFSVLIIQSGQPGSTRAALRFLSMFTLGVPFFLMAAWRYDLYQQGTGSLADLSLVALFTGLGFAFWLALVPLHGWYTAVSSDAPPLVAAYILLAFPLTAMTLLLQQMNDAPWLTELPQIAPVLLIAGLLMLAVGASMAAVQRAFGSLMGYSALSLLGLVVISLSFGGRTALSVGLYLLTVYTLTILLTAIPTALFRHYNTSDAFVLALGKGRQWPLLTGAYLIAGLTLSGAPFFAGFPAHWMLMGALTTESPAWVPPILLLCLGSAVGYLRGLRYLIHNPNKKPGETNRIPLMIKGLLIALSLFSLFLGLFPQELLKMIGPLLNSGAIPSF